MLLAIRCQIISSTLGDTSYCFCNTRAWEVVPFAYVPILRYLHADVHGYARYSLLCDDVIFLVPMENEVAVNG